MHAKTREMAKAGPPTPSLRPMATARAVTVAECDDGIPPESSIRFESHLLSLYLRAATQNTQFSRPFDSKISKFIFQIEKFSCGKNWNWRNEKLYGPGGEELEELSESAGEERSDEREVRRDRCSRRRWRRRRRIRGRHHLVRFSIPIN